MPSAFGDFGSFGSFGGRPSRQSAYPISPEEQQSLLGWLGQSALEGVGYIGASLGKPGRAVRGALGGNAREALSFLPFSDAIGLTDPTQEVRGTELVGLDRDASFFSPEGLTGLGIEIALDPLTYLSFGGSAVNKLGQAAKKAGVLPKGAAGRIAGVTGSEADTLAKALGMHIDDVAGKPLGGHVGFGLPFGMSEQAAFDLTPVLDPLSRGAKAAWQTAEQIPGLGAIPRGISSVGRGIGSAASAVGDVGRALFDPTVENQFGEFGQDLGRRIYGAKQAAKTDALESMTGVLRAMGPEDVLGDAQGLRTALEGSSGPVSAGAQRAAPVARQALDDVLAEEAHWGAATPGVKREKYFPRQATQTELDIARPGRPAGSFQTGQASTLPRQFDEFDAATIESLVKDPQISTSARALKDPAQAAQALAAKLGKPVDDDIVRLSDWLYSLDPKRLDIGFFSHPALTDLEQRLISGKRTVATYKELAQTMAGAGVSKDAAGAGARSLGAVIQSVAKEPSQFRQRLLELMPNVQNLDDVYLPKNVADAIERATKPFVMPELLKPIAKVFDQINSLTKGLLTQPFLSFHIRNRASNFWQNYVMLGMGDLKGAYDDAARIWKGDVVEGLGKVPGLTGADDAARTLELADEAFSRGVTYGGITQDIAGTSGLKDTAMALPGLVKQNNQLGRGVLDYAKGVVPTSKEAAIPWKTRGVGGATESTFAPMKAGEELSRKIESMDRLAGYIGLRKQGYTADVAADMVKAAQVDYSALSSFEKQVMKRVFPFYSWSRKALPYQLEQILTQPGGKTATALKVAAKARGNEPGFTPEWLGSGVALPIGEQGEDGRQKFLSRLGLPFESLGELTNPGNMALGMLNPIFKYPLEQATGKQFFSGRELSDVYSMIGNATGYPMPGLENMLFNSPVSRFLSTGRQFVDPKKSWSDILLNLTTGAKISDVNMAQARDAMIRERTRDMLRGNPNVRSFETPYVRAEDMANLTPEQRQLYALLRNR